jgi:hypothetical protein
VIPRLDDAIMSKQNARVSRILAHASTFPSHDNLLFILPTGTREQRKELFANESVFAIYLAWHCAAGGAWAHHLMMRDYDEHRKTPAFKALEHLRDVLFNEVIYHFNIPKNGPIDEEFMARMRALRHAGDTSELWMPWTFPQLLQVTDERNLFDSEDFRPLMGQSSRRSNRRIANKLRLRAKHVWKLGHLEAKLRLGPQRYVRDDPFADLVKN